MFILNVENQKRRQNKSTFGILGSYLHIINWIWLCLNQDFSINSYILPPYSMCTDKLFDVSVLMLWLTWDSQSVLSRILECQLQLHWTMQSLATLGNEQKLLSGEHKTEQNTLSDFERNAITLKSSLTIICYTAAIQCCKWSKRRIPYMLLNKEISLS